MYYMINIVNNWPPNCWVIANEDIPHLNIVKGVKATNTNSKGFLNFNGAQIDQSLYSKFSLSSKYDESDVVAITDEEYHTDGVYIPLGQVGSIVYIFSNSDHTYASYEVEFCDDEGRTLYQGAIEEDHLLRLKFN